MNNTASFHTKANSNFLLSILFILCFSSAALAQQLNIVDNNTNNNVLTTLHGHCTGPDFIYNVYWNDTAAPAVVEVVNTAGTILASGATSPIQVKIFNNSSTTAFSIQVREQANVTNISTVVSVAPKNCTATQVGADLNYNTSGAKPAFSVPAGITHIRTSVIGGGGNGSSRSGGNATGGGGGAAAAVSVFEVTTGEIFNITVGAGRSNFGGTARGGTSSINNGAGKVVSAQGGQGRGQGNASGGGRGNASASVGERRFNGGNGGNRNGRNRGRGGGAGHFLGNGTNGSAGANGKSSSPGGNGGNNIAQAGFSAGGGGAGRNNPNNGGTGNGGRGGHGYARIETFNTDVIAPTVTVEQTSTQMDPIFLGSSTLAYTATFSEPITVSSLDCDDVLLSGTATATCTGVLEMAPNDGTTFEITITPTTVGTVIASLPAASTHDLAGNNNETSISVDNIITINNPLPDFDKDGIPDITDLDDDNDGIIDTDEQNCAPDFIALGQTFSSTAISGTVPNTFAFGGADVTIGYELIGSNPGTNPSWRSGITNRNNGAIDPNGQHVNFQPNNTDFNIGDVAVYTIDFINGPVYNLEFKWGGLDASDRLDILASYQGANVPVTITDINLGADVTFLGPQSVVSTAGGASAPSNSIQLTIAGPVDQFIVTVGKQNGNAGNATTQLYEMIYCLGVDSDNDMISDHLDTDSDNDGCQDALEGTGTFTTGDLTVDDNLANDAAGVDSDGIPNVGSQTTTADVTEATQVTVDTLPTNQVAIGGANAVFTVVASATSTTTYSGTAPNTSPDYTSGTNEATGLRYQWQENSGAGFTNITNGGIYSGTTTASLTLTGVLANMNGYDYKVIITHIDNNCILEEAEAELTVFEAVDDMATTNEDEAVTIDILDNDNNVPTTGSLNIISAPTNGTVVVNDGGTPLDPSDDMVTYTPNTGYNGTDSFDYEICDAATPTANCSPAEVTITVNPTPDAVDDSEVTDEDIPVTIDVLDNDSDVPTTGSLNITSTPTNGTVVVNDGGTPLDPSDDTVTYTPNTDYNGTDSFDYEICDAATPIANCSPATVNITIFPDYDEDGVADRIDLDNDNDGILDSVEAGGNSPYGDEDGDGVSNWEDVSDDGNNGDGSLTDYTDTNNNGVPDVYDFDGDGVPNHLDLDSDNDGIYDVVEAGGADSNDDGRADDDDDNTDNTATNGIPTSAGSGLTPTETTAGTPDFLNTDSDEDGCSDALEAGFEDDDLDGVLGDDPITVNTHGLVTSATGYADPQETNSGIADYVDDTINACAEITLLKTGVLVDTNNNGIDDLGDTIDYTFTVTNSGTVDLTDITIIDALVTVLPTTTIDLIAGASDNSTFTATYVLQQTDLNTGSFTNTAIASGKDSKNNTISDSSDDPSNATNVDPDSDGNPDDPTVVDIEQLPSISLLKTGVLEDANSDGFPQEGEKIRYSFTVKNTGNVSLTGITISDPLVTVLGGPINLEPGAMNTNTFYALYDLTQANIDNRSITNAAVVTAKDPNNDDVIDNSDDPTNTTNVDDNADGDPDDDTVIALAKNPKIEIFKTGAFVDTNTDGLGQIGETMGYIFDVRNTGNVTLTNITITDPLGTVVGSPITLAPGETNNTNFSFSYPLTQTDIDAGEVINKATVNALDPDSVVISDTSDDPTTVAVEDNTVVAIATNPKIFLFKTGVFNDENEDTFANPGETITFKFDVRNIGNVTLTDVVVTDPLVTVTGSPITLAPAEFDDTTFSATYVLTQADVEEGMFENQAIVNSEDSTGAVITSISDFSDDPNNPVNIDLDMDGNPDDPTVVDLPTNPSISLLKEATFMDENGDGIAQVGESINYAFTVENTGNVALNNVIVTDALVSVSGSAIASLTPATIDNTTFTATYILTQADIDTQEVINTAVVESVDGGGNLITDDSDDPNNATNIDNNNDGEPDDPTVFAIPLRNSISVTMEADRMTYSNVGEVITYTIVVTNEGNTTLTNISLSGINANITTGSPIPDLAPGESAIVMAEYVVIQADLDAGGIIDSVDAMGIGPDSGIVVDTSDDPSNPEDVDANADGEPDDPTIVMANIDTDGDGIFDAQELVDGTDHLNDCDSIGGTPLATSDCDNDGISNGQEISDGTDPLDSCSSIGGTPPIGAFCGIEIENELITPDGDGINDIFRIRNIETYPDNTVEIYNRWGVKVFTTNGYDNESNAFRGISNGRITIKQNDSLPAGVYFYIINYNNDDRNLTRSGYLYINQ